MLPPGDKPQTNGPLACGIWQYGITARGLEHHFA